MPTTNEGRADVTTALIHWQETGEEQWLRSLVATTMSELEHVAAVSLRRLGVHDRSAVDDALSLVLDHLRRLRGTAPGDQAVARFDAARRSGTRGDPGRAYLTWLVRERSLDVARQRLRLAKHRRPLTDQAIFHLRPIAPRDDRPDDHERREQFHAALERLEPRLRSVVEMLLAGKSQAVIAHVLDVCEGTVSRLRARAIAVLRELLADTFRH